MCVCVFFVFELCLTCCVVWDTRSDIRSHAFFCGVEEMVNQMKYEGYTHSSKIRNEILVQAVLLLLLLF